MLHHLQPSSIFFAVLFALPHFARAFHSPPSTTMRSFLRVSSRAHPSHPIQRLRRKAVRTLVCSTKTENEKNESLSPFFSFGLIADIQYVDAEDATNFAGTTQRFYRHSFNTYKEALQYWQHEVKPFPKCALVLGDILDGKTAQMRYVIPLRIDPNTEDSLRICSLSPPSCCCTNISLYDCTDTSSYFFTNTSLMAVNNRINTPTD